ncbi:hypothetical protein HMPREF6745_1944 [Prevotella sp. oral taxon 472 str. F0295]|jgi:hypothetical protein|nr:hypothetical protein HMPREF6745_1944 [Prevotella sp. oral taxon 472 str. F0295]
MWFQELAEVDFQLQRKGGIWNINTYTTTKSMSIKQHARAFLGLTEHF